MSDFSILKRFINDEIEIFHCPLAGKIKALYSDNTIALNKNLSTTAEQTCILAEELGHHYTTCGDILDQSKTQNIKAEKKARRWAAEKLIQPHDFINAFNAGITNRAELAEYLGVTEKFIDMALEHFLNIHGQMLTLDNYTVCFNPLLVIKNFD